MSEKGLNEKLAGILHGRTVEAIKCRRKRQAFKDLQVEVARAEEERVNQAAGVGESPVSQSLDEEVCFLNEENEIVQNEDSEISLEMLAGVRKDLRAKGSRNFKVGQLERCLLSLEETQASMHC